MSGKEWFSRDLAGGLSPISDNSSVQAFVDAEEYYSDLRREVEATGPGGQICWIGFEGDGATPMPLSRASAPRALKALPPRPPQPDDDKTWLALLTAASDERAVAVRVLLNLHPKPDMDPAAPKKYKTSNFDLVEQLNTLTNCTAINDFRYLWMNGTHHQKLVLVYNDKGLTAYVGTCDIESSRIVNQWCEVHLKIVGFLAAELYMVFDHRWSEHTSVLRRVGAAKSRLIPLYQMKTTAPLSGNFLMQVSTTYGNPDRINPFNSFVDGQPMRQVVNAPHAVLVHADDLATSALLLAIGAPILVGNDFFTGKDPAGTTLLDEAARQSQTYEFARNGHTGIYQAIRHAIENTKEFIYLEDQYLVCDEKMATFAPILELLLAKLGEKQFKKLVILCTRIDDINVELQRAAWKHRGSFLRSLLGAQSDKVVICQYKSRETLHSAFGKPHEGAYYVHSKTWIFDDLFLITGSANCNRRGYSHDSELDVGVYDQNKTFVRQLRMRLWLNRLNTEGVTKAPIAPAQLADFLSATKYWETPSEYGLTIESSRERSLEPIAFPDLDFASYKALVTGDASTASRVKAWIDSARMTGIWDYLVDPDGA